MALLAAKSWLTRCGLQMRGDTIAETEGKRFGIREFYALYFQIDDLLQPPSRPTEAPLGVALSTSLADGVRACSTSSTCTICFANPQDCVLPCMHTFCWECIERWKSMGGSCPNCRRPVEMSQAFDIAPSPSAEEIAAFVVSLVGRP